MISTYESHGFNFNISSLGKRCHLEGCPGWLVVLEELAVDLVDLRELSDIFHQDGRLHDILVSPPRGLEDLPDVPECLLSLGQSASLHQRPRLCHPQLTRDVQGPVHQDSLQVRYQYGEVRSDLSLCLVVRSDGIWGAGAVDQLPAH